MKEGHTVVGRPHDRGIEVLDKITATGGQPVLVLSGGQGADGRSPEAAAMARYAIEQGVPADRIIEEDTSTTTEENLRNTRDVLAERGYEWSTMAVVTSNFHALRAVSLTRRLGLPATVIGARRPAITYRRASCGSSPRAWCTTAGST